MRDRRHFKRFFIEGMGIHCRLMSGTEVKLLNLSPAGAYIMLTEKLNVGDDYTLQIERKGLNISVKGKVESVESAGGEVDNDAGYVSAYVAGIKFDEKFPGEDSEVLGFIKSNISHDAKKSGEKDLSVKVVSTDKAQFYKGNYHITDISFGGMQIESEQHMEIDTDLEMEIVFSMNKSPVKVMGRVASCKKIPDQFPPRYITGIEFVDIGKKDILALKDFIYFVQEL